MATRRLERKTATARSQAGRPADATRAQNVLLEQLKSQMDGVLEAVMGSRTYLDTKIDAVEKRLSERISVLEEVVRQNSEDIRKNSEDIRKNSEDIRKNSADIRELREEVARLRYDFDHRTELGRVAALEGRVTALEKRVGVTS